MGTRNKINWTISDSNTENIVKGAADRPSGIQLARSSILLDILRSSVVVAQAAADRLIARKAVAGRNDEVRK